MSDLAKRALLGGAALTFLLFNTAQAQNVRAQLERLKQEPGVRDVQEAALGYFRVNQDTVASMRSRASGKAAVPVFEVSGGFARSSADEDTANFEQNFDPWIVKAGGAQGFDVRGKLVWDLPRLVFNAEELDVASLAGLMEGILKESTRLFFMRRRLQVDMILNPPTDQATLLSKQLRLEELTALIDAMTGGWFQRELKKRGLLGAVPASNRAPAHTAALKVIPSTQPPSAVSRGARSVLRRPAAPPR